MSFYSHRRIDTDTDRAFTGTRTSPPLSSLRHRSQRESVLDRRRTPTIPRRPPSLHRKQQTRPQSNRIPRRLAHRPSSPKPPPKVPAQAATPRLQPETIQMNADQTALLYRISPIPSAMDICPLIMAAPPDIKAKSIHCLVHEMGQLLLASKFAPVVGTLFVWA